MSRRVYLIRHGRPDFPDGSCCLGRTDIPLGTIGHMQSCLAARELEHAGISAVFTSPLSRARETCISALDVSIQAQVVNLMKDIQAETQCAYLFIAHDLSMVKYISDRIGVMYLGNMVELANTQELFDHPLHPYTEALMAAIPTTDVEENRELRILEGDIPSPVNPPQGCKFHTRCPYATDRCREEAPCQREVEPGHYVVCHLYDEA